VKLRLKRLFQDIEVEGTPEECAAFVKALETVQLTSPLSLPNPPVFVPTFQILDVCPQGGAHEYPEVWMSVSPPACRKCGQASASQPYWTVTTELVRNPATPYTVTKVGADGYVAQPVGPPALQGCTD